MHAKKTNKTKVLAVVLALVLVVGCAAGATLAWLMDTTQEVVNTFTYGDINITLTENDNGVDNDNNANTNSYKMIPGNTITKDPKVTVVKDSEACWLFVKIVKSENFPTYLTYTIADGWTALAGETGVYWRKVDATTADTPFDVLKNNQVVVSQNVTKEQLRELGTNYPTLTFTAYAVQQENVANETLAWGYVKP